MVSKQVPETKHWTSTYTDYDTVTLDASYNEALRGKIVPSKSRAESLRHSSSTRGAHATSASSGSVSIDKVEEAKTSAILKSAEKARAHEKPLRDQIDAVEDLTGGIRDKYPANIAKPEDHQKVLKSLDDARAQLMKAEAERLAEYKKMKSGDVTGQWKDDRPEHFAERNKQLDERFLHMMNRIDHFREQIQRKVAHLEYQYTVPDRSPQLAQIDARMRTRRIRATTAGVAATAAAGGAGYYVFGDDERKDRVFRFFGASGASAER
jgi:hypothetical protein